MSRNLIDYIKKTVSLSSVEILKSVSNSERCALTIDRKFWQEIFASLKIEI